MDSLLDAILITTTNTCPRVRYWGVRALANQAKKEACSFFLLHTPTVANAVAKTLANLVNDKDPDVREVAVTMIVGLSSNPLNHRALSRNAALMASVVTETYNNDSEAAVLILLRLASSEKMRGILAKQYNLTASLSKFGLLSNKQIDVELKKGALQCVIRLVPFM
jgi:hypothetical protein